MTCQRRSGLFARIWDFIKIKSMKIEINGRATDTTATNLQTLSQELNLPETGVAVAVNNRMVPRTEWTSTALNEGDSVVIIKAACGG